MSMSYNALGGRKGGVAMVDGIANGIGQLQERHARHAVLQDDGHTVVAALANAGYKRNLAQQLHVEFLGKNLAAVAAEDIVFLVGVRSRCEPRHVLNNAKHRDTHMLAHEH